LAASGAKVLLGARRHDRLEAIAQDIANAGGQVEIRPIEVTKRSDLTDFVKTAEDKFGRLDQIASSGFPLFSQATLQRSSKLPRLLGFRSVRKRNRLIPPSGRFDLFVIMREAVLKLASAPATFAG
jgi:hypothetical protein